MTYELSLDGHLWPLGDTIARAVVVTCPQCDADLADGIIAAYARGRTYVPGTTCPECAGADKDPIDPEVAALRREAAKAKRQARRPRRQVTA
jgi:hypothetical protein